MQPDIQHWRDLSALLDELLARPAEERERWIDALPPHQAIHAAELRRVLNAAQQVDRDEAILARPLIGEPTLADMLAEAEATAKDGDMVGPYRLLRLIGRGGMGVVWLAERSDGLLQRSVAIKLPVLEHGASRLIARFARERSILAALNHPNIARLYDAGVTEDRQPYLVMEYVPGVSLIDYCDAEKLSVQARLHLFLQVLAAVQYAHGLTIVHRDIKPSNILVTQNGEVRLLDFGIAKLLDEHEFSTPDLTQLTGPALTQHFASPEQVQRHPIGIGSDVYSLGVVLCHLLAARSPYALKSDSRAELEAAIVSMEPRRLTSIRFTEQEAFARRTTTNALSRTLRGDLDAILQKALRKQPSERYMTVQSFAEDIERYLRGDVVTAKPVSVWYRARKFVGRYKVATALATTAVVSLVLGSGVALWQSHRAKLQADAAEREAATANAMKDFMASVLANSSADRADAQIARQRTAEQILNKARDRVIADRAMPPDARIAVLNTLQDIYAGLFMTTDARVLALATVDAIRARGPRRSDADAFTVAASTLDTIDPQAAVNLIAEAEALGTERDPHPPEMRIALLLARAGHLQNGLNDTAGALKAMDQAEQLHRQHPEVTDPSLLRTRTMKALYLLRADRFSDVQRVAEEALAPRLSGEPSPSGPDAAVLESLRATALAEQFKVKEAEAAYLHSQSTGEAAGGVAFPQALFARCHRARLLARIAQDPEALKIARAVKEVSEGAQGGSRALLVPMAWKCLGDVQLALGDGHSALASGRQAIALDERVNSADYASSLRLVAKAAALTGDEKTLASTLQQLVARPASQSQGVATAIEMLHIRAALLRGEAALARSRLRALRVNAQSLSALENGIEVSELWRQAGDLNEAQSVASALLHSTAQYPEWHRLSALQRRLSSFKQ